MKYLSIARHGWRFGLRRFPAVVAVALAGLLAAWLAYGAWPKRIPESVAVNSGRLLELLIGPAKCPPHLDAKGILVGCDATRLEESDTLAGSVDILQIRDSRLLVSGWVADLRNFTPARMIVLALDGKPRLWIRPEILRQDVAIYFKRSSIAYSGYTIDVPIPAGFWIASHEIRVFAVGNDALTKELKLPAPPAANPQ